MTVHNHDIDPSCKEGYINGELKGECIAPLEPLKIRNMAFDNYLDSDGELRAETEGGDGWVSTYLTRNDVEALRDHLNLLLEGSKPEPKKGEVGYIMNREEAADFARRWDARVTGNLNEDAL